MDRERNVAVARASYEAYVTKDRAALERLIADDFHFTSPLDNRINRATYFERCWPNSERIGGYDFIHLVPDGDCVFVTYEGRATGGKRFRNTEILTFRSGQITDAEVYFGWSMPEHKDVTTDVAKFPLDVKGDRTRVAFPDTKPYRSRPRRGGAVRLMGSTSRR